MVATKYLFIGLASLGVALAGGADDIKTSIGKIEGSISTLSTTLKGFNANDDVTGTALKLQGQAKDLLTEINDGKDTAGKASIINSADSDKLDTEIHSLSKNVFDLLDGFVEKKPVFQKAVLGGSADGLVDKDLKDLKEATDGFGHALEKIVSGKLKQEAPGLISDLDKHFDEAIKAFST